MGEDIQETIQMEAPSSGRKHQAWVRSILPQPYSSRHISWTQFVSYRVVDIIIFLAIQHLRLSLYFFLWESVHPLIGR